MENYVDALKVDKEVSENYYKSSIHTKTEQQKKLEELIVAQRVRPKIIADIACGGGGMSYNLSRLFPDASYTLVDMNEDAISLALESTKHMDASCLIGDIYDLQLESDSYDMVVCWQTLSWVAKPKNALRELIRICKPGGRVYASSLFNFHHDVDIYSTVKDQTRKSTAEGYSCAYNTYAVSSVQKWVDKLVSDIKVHEFNISVDLDYTGKGLGTYTARLENGTRLQMSAGMLLNWGILELQK